MKAVSKIPVFYSTIFAGLLLISGAAGAKTTQSLLGAFFFFPVFVFYLLNLFKPATSEVAGRILAHYSFLVIGIIVVMSLLGARGIVDVTISLLMLPLLVQAFLVIMPKRQRSLATTVIVQPEKAKEEITRLKKEKVDINRRAFLKLIGSAGVTMFLFAIFTKRAEAAFFGSVPGPGTVALKDSSGTVINPAKHHPTDGYKISQLDDSSPAYYGFTDKDGNWFIMKEDSSGNYRYAKGSSNFSTNWTNRNSLSYDYFENVF